MKKQVEQAPISLEIIRFPALYKKIGLCRTQIWRLEKEGSFPKSVPLGGKNGNSKGWFLHEVDAWLLSRRQQS